ncbi:bifunctional serine/threonine-protein kinase/ABC transporter substrate-binding protein [Streptomyces litchfieldiae]|uniref:Bifunctional serine/threonine-protein kinase/ABC transporter substrate-binding protein n=1 Tax=Streptomyces litchfieldiae TaxID=3075543 RepID=A0ABU2MRV1_9ACTN|nr:bifunctional serine/threonine-protein kinase/ABC transporter substrate-binding protein [Streptomyces sp. DSM 44938]MDT0344345.1 bifunctional serine/threonine-protein kinase/ABC transporter substrate-binding protein [Streptomyces sp. DSM 44938]
MKPLEPTDPRRIGGYRLLRRLARGRTGLVYLATSLGGTPTALKVIDPQHSRAPGFRARFERDVAAARHVTARGLATVLAADTAGTTTWAAHPYVPGPPLPEVLAAHGPLPPRATRLLGARLAEALGAVHDAGLAHRDVRPGHVLLMPDGPVLTGFGGSGTRTGQPGYLSPEQARGVALSPGPADDVFALGCVLAHAVTGRPPFGRGTDQELLLRALTEPPDLADVPRSLLEVVQACLHRDPVPRPTAADLRAELDLPAADGRLPDPVARRVAARVAAPLPEPHPERPPPAPAPRAAPPEPTLVRRRGVLVLGAATAVGVVGVLAGREFLDARRGGATAPADAGYAIGLHTDLTGSRAHFGRGQERGVTMAVEELNKLGRLPFALRLLPVDDRGDPDLAVAAARQLAADRSVLAVIGPTGDEVAGVAADIYAEAGVPLLALSVGSFGSREEYGTLLHARPDVGYTGLVIPGYVTDGLGAHRVGLIDDRAADTYSSLTTRAVSGAIDRARIELLPRVVPVGTEDFTPVAAEFADADIDVVVYCGFARGAGRLARALREAGFTGRGLATQEALGPVFLREAGDAAEGWLFVATYTDPGGEEAGQGFVSVHRERFGSAPGPYAAEGYDAARMLVDAMRGAAEEGARLTRAGLLSRLRGARYHGVARELAFDAAGHYAGEGPMAYLYEAESGEFRFRGPVPSPGT